MKKTLLVAPVRKELLFGGIYILLELFVLPYPLAMLNRLLAEPLSAGELNVIFFILNFGITTLIFRAFLKRTLLDAAHRLSGIIFAAIRGFLLYWAGNILLTMLIFNIDPEFININDANIADMAESAFLPMAICSVFLVPITEELLFRGVLFAGIYKRSPFKAFLISVVVFSAIHIMGYLFRYPWETLLLCFLQYLPASIALGWAYAKSGNILSPILIHITVNAIGIYHLR